MQKPLRLILERLNQYTDEVIRLQKLLTCIPAIGPESDGKGEAEKSALIKSILTDMQIDELIEVNAPDSRVPSGYRPNMLIKLNGSANTRTLWIMSHMDVVPPGESSLWHSDPYEAVVRDGRIYGRGTEDNQQGIISSLLLIKALRETGITPCFDIGLAIVSDEENGSKFGIEHVLKKHPDRFRKEDWIVIPDAGNEDGTMIEVAEKSILWIKCEIRGKQTHGSTPEKGINAHFAGANLIVQMDELHRVYDASDPVYDPPISTFSVTRKESNVDNINTIPGSDVIYFDCRILPEYDLNKVKRQVQAYAAQIENRFGVEIRLSMVQDVPAPPPTPPDTPVAIAIQNAVRDILSRDAVSMGIGGGTVAALFRSAGLPAVCWCTVDDTLHGPDEYSKIENTINDAKVFAYLCMQP
ncbi:M20 family metallo-hydrolase [bacterium]|nr:M20 family metallo-hydrolase [bacterium]